MNKTYVYTSYAMIELKKRNGEIYYAYIDVEDVSLLEGYHFSLNAKGYAYDSSKDMLLHRLIMDAKEDEIVDHKNHNTLDCTRANLRKCTQAENNSNRKCINKLGVSNIRYRFDKQKFYVEFKHNGGKMFDNFYEAFNYRNKKAVELFGDYSYQQECYELYKTNNEEEVMSLYSRGFHWIDYIDGTYTYILSEQLRKELTFED